MSSTVTRAAERLAARLEPVAHLPVEIGQRQPADAALRRAADRGGLHELAPQPLGVDREIAHHAARQRSRALRRPAPRASAPARRYCCARGDLGAERLPPRASPSADRRACRAAERHHVGLALGDDRLGLLRRGDQADHAGRDAGLALDPLGDRHVVARRRRLAGVGGDAARRDVDEVEAGGLQRLRIGHGVVGGEAAVRQSIADDARAERERSSAPRPAPPARSRGRSACGSPASRRSASVRWFEIGDRNECAR